MITLDSPTESGVRVRERKVCRVWCFPATSAMVVATEVCFRRPQMASLQEEVNPRAVAVLPLPARFWGIRASGRYGEGGAGRVQTFSLCFEIQRSKDSFTN